LERINITFNQAVGIIRDNIEHQMDCFGFGKLEMFLSLCSHVALWLLSIFVVKLLFN